MSEPRHLYRRQTTRMYSLGAAAAVAAAGGVVLKFYGGSAGYILLFFGMAALIFALVKARSPLVSIEATRIVLRFGAVADIPFSKIARVEQLKSHDVELCLASGAKMVLPMARLEDEDATWLRRELRRGVRSSNAKLRA